ncbi:MAG: hypothetical protein Q8O93_02235 [bacterium]|nr:hypothetical protein [bacterium]
MPKITWINLLHFYQPPTADDETVIEAVEKSYNRIITALKEAPRAKFTVNITGCLLEKLAALGYDRLIGDLNKLRERGQIELTGSAAFHSLLALLPEAEIIRQIKTNEQILKKHFGRTFKASGFFIPEMAYGAKAARLIKKSGYRWLMLDEISAVGKLGVLDCSKIYTDKNSGLKIIFRQRKNSKGYVPKIISELMEQGGDNVAITATDAELYGLRHIDFTGRLEKLLGRPDLKAITVSQYADRLKSAGKIPLVPSSWESTERELKNNLPYFLWHNPKNKIQTLLWQLADQALKAVNKNTQDQNYLWARQHLDRGLSSCTFWWASAHDFRLYGPISWNPDEIERGTNELIRAVRALADPKTKTTKIEAEKLYIKIKRLIWHKHWHYYWLK